MKKISICLLSLVVCLGIAAPVTKILADNVPVISGISGPASLNVGATGTWTISASDPANGSLSYNVDWGDQINTSPPPNPQSASAWQQSTSFTHVYNTNGIYTVTFNVSNASGATAKTTISVNVSSTYIQVTSPTGGDLWVQDSTQTIKWSAPASVSNVNISITGQYVCPLELRQNCPSVHLLPISIASNVPNSGYYVWTIPTTFSGQYYISVADAGGSSLAGESMWFSIIAVPSPHPAGTNILSNGTVYFIAPPPPAGGGVQLLCGQPSQPACPPQPQPTLIAYPSAAVFTSYGFNSWANVAPATSEDMKLSINGLMPYADGNLVNDQGTIYVISNGIKHGIASASVFLFLGYNWGSVVSGGTSFMQSGPVISSVSAHMPGTLINQNGTVYYISAYGKEGFPSMAVFNSWGFNLKNVVTANTSDLALPINSYSSIISVWIMGKLSPAVYPPVLYPLPS